MFYLAQVYSQKGDVEKGISYCSQTMTRQMANKTYQTKDFCVNCLNLANYFSLQKNYAQAEYLLYTAQTLLPENQEKKTKLRANIQVQIGEYYVSLMTHLIRCHVGLDQFDEVLAAKKIVEFPEVNLKWPTIKPVTCLADAVLLFKLGNT